MLVVHVAFECVPIYKTGGLADVVGSLPKSLAELGIETAVMLPGYHWLVNRPRRLPGSNVPVLYVESPFFTSQLKKNPSRKLLARAYADFARYVLEELQRKQIKPDIIHCHDWHAALIPVLLRKYPQLFLSQTKTLLTLHNAAFQGRFPVRHLQFAELHQVAACFDQRQKLVSYLKEGIKTADFVSTVSPYHATELRSGKVSFGLKQVLQHKIRRFTGILNGVDYTVWNPEYDHLVKKYFNQKTVRAAKTENKIFLQRKLGLEDSPDIPLFGFIARLTGQKGLDILLPLLKTISRKRIQIVILGSGQKKYQRKLLIYQQQIDRRWYSINVGFDEKLAHQIYAGSDFFLVPSVYEPCGLTQMIAMAYGSIPIVSPVGGLKDTVVNGKTGFYLPEVSTGGLAKAIEQAVDLWEDKKAHTQMVLKVMHKNFSWEKSAKIYLKLYNELLRLPR